MTYLYWVSAVILTVVSIHAVMTLIRRFLRLQGAKRPLRVYVAGPYTQGDPETNVGRAIEAADLLLLAGYMPYVPHLSHFWHELRPHDYETWMTLDFAFLATCDALVRIRGDSPGADREVKLAGERGIPVYYGVEEFLQVHLGRRAHT